MKTLLAVVSIALLSTIVWGQQSSGRPRRGLDQLDLLSMPGSTRSPAEVYIDFETYKLLAPLVDRTNELQMLFRDRLVDGRSVDRNTFYEAFGRKTVAFYRSIAALKEAKKEIPAPAVAKLSEIQEMSADIGRVASVIRFGDEKTFRKEITQLFARYGIDESNDYATDRERVIATILREIASELTKFKPVNY
jgi:hypothetical protein